MSNYVEIYYSGSEGEFALRVKFLRSVISTQVFWLKSAFHFFSS